MISRAKRGAATAIICLCLVAPGRASRAEADGWFDGASLELSGSLRQVGLYTRQTDAEDFERAVADDLASGDLRCVQASAFASCPAFGLVGEHDVAQGLTRLRIGADFVLREGFSAAVSYDNQLGYGVLDTLERQLASGGGAGSFLGAEAVLDSGRHHQWRHELYRGYLKFETQHFELSIGRQRVAWGVGRLWTPIDRFSALPPLSVQPDVTPGIDGIDTRFNFDGFNYLQFVYAPGEQRRFARYAARFHGVAWDADWSIMGGLFEEAPSVGVDFARNLGDAAIRFEAVFTSPEHEVFEIGSSKPATPSDYWQIVASFDINLDYGTGIYFLAEYLYNQNALGFGEGEAGALLEYFEATDVSPSPGLDADLGPFVKEGTADLFAASRVVTLATHQLGLQAGYDLTPELRGDLVSLIDISGGSAAFFPNLVYSPLDALEITLGVQLFAGPRRSQYGGSEPLVFALTDWFF
ncbi:MAG: hypothetical protein GY733_09470 [bacterium]|nr:hypothetical protein [bacterium]